MERNPISHEDAKQAFAQITLANGKNVTLALSAIVLRESDNRNGYQTLIVQGEGLLVTEKVYNEIILLLNCTFYIFKVGLLHEE